MQTLGRRPRTWRHIIALVSNIGSNGIAVLEKDKAGAIRQVHGNAQSKIDAENKEPGSAATVKQCLFVRQHR